MSDVLDEPLARRARTALGDLWSRLDGARAIAPSRLGDAWTRATFAEGAAGLVVAQAHRALAADDERIADGCRDAVIDAVDRGGELRAAPGLIQGLAGLGYALEHVVGLGLVEGAGEVTDAIAGRLCAELAASPIIFDLFFGAAGLVVYGVERAAASSRLDVLSAALARIEDAAERGSGAAWWVTPADPRWIAPATARRHPEGHVNATMAPGVAGGLAALAAAVGRGLAGDRSAALVAAVLEWMWRARDAGGTRQWPVIVGDAVEGSGWCKGDLGVAAAVIAGGRALSDPRWIERGVEAARIAVTRRDWADAAVSLCHGPAGAAHIANRLYASTGDPAFAAAARDACAAALDHLDGGDIGPGLLNGDAGVALSLLSLVDPGAARWDSWFVPGLT